MKPFPYCKNFDCFLARFLTDPIQNRIRFSIKILIGIQFVSLGHRPNLPKSFWPVDSTIYRAKVYNIGYKSTRYIITMYVWRTIVKTILDDKVYYLHRKIEKKDWTTRSPSLDKEKIYFFEEGFDRGSSIILNVFKMSIFYQRNRGRNFGHRN